MIALAAALLLGAAPLPAHVDARYRVELGGEPIGWARLAVACEGEGCRATWESALRAPAEAGGGTVARRIAIAARPDGAARAVEAASTADGRTRRRADGPGPVPASLAELLLAAAEEGEERCLEVREEESGRDGRACARRHGPWLSGEVLGEPIAFRAAAGEAPAEVVVPGQRVRFVADAAAALPARAPRLYGATVAPPGARPARVCGRAADPAPPPAPAAVPRAWPGGASCRERTARYLADAAARGLTGRHAVGVAFDGTQLVWHEWAELRLGGRWIPVDPSFEQAPAEGPRFTVARWADGDDAARAVAGRAVLACWVAAAP